MEGAGFLTGRVRPSDTSVCIFSFFFYLQNKTLLRNILHVISGCQVLERECFLLSLLFAQKGSPWSLLAALQASVPRWLKLSSLERGLCVPAWREWGAEPAGQECSFS